MVTGARLRAVREELSLSTRSLERALGLRSEGRAVRRWEADDQPIPGPIQLIVELAERDPTVGDILVKKALES
jgi:transcriptional regulator with XRE-family HTH domain